MYEKILAQMSPVVETASSGQDAINRIKNVKNDKFHILSCDINLGSTHPRTTEDMPDTSIPGADGRAVLRLASKLEACNGVVVITGLQHDEELEVVIPDEVERKHLKMALDTYLQELFPGRNLCLNKHPDVSVTESIAVYMEKLRLEELLKLCDVYNRFSMEGNKWVVTFNGTTKFFNNIKGMHDIACLLKHQGKNIHSMELVRAEAEITPKSSPYSKMSGKQLEEAGLPVSGRGDGDKILTDEAKEFIRTQLEELEAEIEDAEYHNDTGRALILKQRREEIIEELERAYGYGQRSENREFADEGEDARQAVSKRIKLAIKALKQHPELHAHLCNYIHTGYFCRYSPPNPVFWSF